MKSQNGAFYLSKASTGGSGLRSLAPLKCPVTGYCVQDLREEAKASIVYIIPLNENIDTTPVADVAPQRDGVLSKCLGCDKNIPLWEFTDHKSKCQVSLLTGRYSLL